MAAVQKNLPESGFFTSSAVPLLSATSTQSRGGQPRPSRQSRSPRFSVPPNRLAAYSPSWRRCSPRCAITSCIPTSLTLS